MQPYDCDVGMLMESLYSMLTEGYRTAPKRDNRGSCRVVAYDGYGGSEGLCWWLQLWHFERMNNNKGGMKKMNRPYDYSTNANTFVNN